MSPITHLLASWIVAAKTTDNLRDRRLVSLAGVAPDLDGLGIIVDIVKGNFARGDLVYYPTWHHWLAHGLPAAVVISAALAACARRKGRVLGLGLLVFHLHLLCDYFGSRGPGRMDYWYIYYLGPFSLRPRWAWDHQWALDAWPNRVITVVLFFWSLWLAVKMGDSFVGVINRRVDKVFVDVLRKWVSQLGLRRQRKAFD